jgi:hypothetical protein
MKTGMGCFLGLAAFLSTAFIVQLPTGASAQAVGAQDANRYHKYEETCAKQASKTHDILVLIQRADVHGAEQPEFGQVTDDSAPISGENPGDIYFEPCPKDPVKITFRLQGLNLTHWETSKDLHGNVTANDSISMRRYKHGHAHHHPGARDWPHCKAKLINTSGTTDIFFDFSACPSPTYDYEYMLHVQLCDPTNSSICVNHDMDPQIVFHPSTVDR